MSAARSKDAHLCARHRRMAARRRTTQAVVAVDDAILVAVWHLDHDRHRERRPGGDYFTRHHSERAKARVLDQLRQFGTDATLSPAQMLRAG